MSKKFTLNRADFCWLPDGIEIPSALWKAPKAFLATHDVRYYFHGIHFAPCAQVWATNGHMGVTIDLPHVSEDEAVPSWFPADGVTFLPPKLPTGTYTTRAFPTDEKGDILPTQKNAVTGYGEPLWRLECYDRQRNLIATLNLYTTGGRFPNMHQVMPQNFDDVVFDTDQKHDKDSYIRPFVPTTTINTRYLAALGSILPSSKSDFNGVRIKCTGRRLLAHLVGYDNWATNILVVIMGMRI